MFVLITIRSPAKPSDMDGQGIFVVSGEPDDGQSLADHWNAGIGDAKAFGSDWIFFQEPGVELSDHAFDAAAPGLASYDAVWGAMAIDGATQKLSTFTCDSLPDAWHLALVWWAGRSHFVKTEVVSSLKFDGTKGEGWFADYFLRIWQSNRCLKTAQPYVDGCDNLPMWSDMERQVVIDFLATSSEFISINYAGEAIKLPYTGKNPTIERNQLRGVFFEQRDLEGLKDFVRPGSVIVDVGSNTGNHTVFFARILKAKRVIVIEPNPETAKFLQATIVENGLDQVDASILGFGAGECSGQFYLKTGRRGHLGTVRLDTEGDIPIEVKALDDLISEPVDFIKIDVEDMEVAVLKGARRIFTQLKPTALVEVQDENITAFLAIIEELGYRVERIFADHGYANYLIMPEGND
jgi:FkbM family methyltransferase